MNKNFKISMLIGLIFAVCMYNNPAGITFPIMVAVAVIALAGLTVGCKLKFCFTDVFYATACIVLGISIIFTQDMMFHIFTKTLILTLMVFYLIRKFYGVKNVGIYRGVMYIMCFFAGMIANIGAPFMELDVEKGEAKKEKRASNRNLILLGILIAIPILIIVLSLLTSADVVFRRVLLNLFDSFDDIRNICKAITYFFIGFFACYSMAKTAYDKQYKLNLGSITKYNPIVAITVSITLSFVYIVFCVIQIVTLFGKGTYFLPQGYTYSAYAREGFYQLVVVAIINMMIMFICKVLFKKSKVLVGTLTIISACTFILIASSAYRLLMYIDMYHLTMARIFGIFIIIALALYMVGLTISMYIDRFPVFEYILAMTTLVYMGMVLIRPDVLIAKENVKYIEEKQDVRYLIKELSYDAAPYLVNIEGYDEILENYYEDILEECETKDIRKFNISRYNAYKTAKKYLGDYDKDSDFACNK